MSGCERCGDPQHCACTHGACCSCGSKGHARCGEHPDVDSTVEHHESWCPTCMRAVTRRCPCGHAVDSEGDPDQYACLNGLIYGPCGDENCDGICADDYGACKTLGGCCDPENQED